MSEPNRNARLVMVIAALGIGGTERVFVNMANYWAEKGLDVFVVTLSNSKDAHVHQFHEGIQSVSVPMARSSRNPIEGIKNNIGRIGRIRNTLMGLKPDIVVSFLDRTNILVLLASKPLKCPIIVADRADPHCVETSATWQFIRKLTYPRAAAVMIQTSRFKPSYTKKIQALIQVVQNSIPNRVNEVAPSSWDSRPEKVITVGRLVAVKNFHVLIEAFAQVAPKFPTWSLELYGEGPERKNLQDQIDATGVGERISLRGSTNEPLEMMNGASIFALTSESEGMPNALMEAMAMGCACVSTDVGGVPDLIDSGKNGFIVPVGGVSDLAKAFEALMGSPDLRKTFGERAQNVRERFAEDRIMDQWDGVLRGALAGKKNS